MLNFNIHQLKLQPNYGNVQSPDMNKMINVHTYELVTQRDNVLVETIYNGYAKLVWANSSPHCIMKFNDNDGMYVGSCRLKSLVNYKNGPVVAQTRYLDYEVNVSNNPDPLMRLLLRLITPMISTRKMRILADDSTNECLKDIMAYICDYDNDNEYKDIAIEIMELIGNSYNETLNRLNDYVNRSGVASLVTKVLALLSRKTRSLILHFYDEKCPSNKLYKIDDGTSVGYENFYIIYWLDEKEPYYVI